MDYDLRIPDKDFQVIWAGLGELPAKFSFAVMERLKEQVVKQEVDQAFPPIQDPKG